MSIRRGGFWPVRGPVWDGAAVVHGRDGSRGVLLIEAKSHTAELESTPSAAEGESLECIRSALDEVKAELGVPEGVDWTQSYYQIANRLAYLHYLRKVGVEAWLASVYFTGDRFENGGSLELPASEEAWGGAIGKAKRALGLPEQHAYSDRVRDLFVPAVVMA